MSGPLGGIRVLDLTQFLAGPFGTQVLGDLGADVIKVEHPSGELARHVPPHFVGSDSAYYFCANRNKRSLALDLKHSDGLRIVRELAEASDVVIESFRPGVLARLGLTYEQVAEPNPGVVWCSLTGFGQEGPYRDRPAYDMIVQAVSGVMSLTGERGGEPVRAGVPIGDMVAGLYATIGILAALEERRRTGRGRVIDVAMLDCQVALLSYPGAYHLIGGVVPGPQGSGHDSIPTYRTFDAGDGERIAVTANTEGMWRKLCVVLELPELAEDARFATGRDRYGNRVELWSLLEPAFLSRGAREWAELLNAAGVPAGVVQNVEVALSDPQVVHRDMVLEMTGSVGTTVRVPGDPLKLGRLDASGHRYPPVLGQDTASILRELGRDDADVAALVEAGAVAVA